MTDTMNRGFVGHACNGQRGDARFVMRLIGAAFCGGGLVLAGCASSPETVQRPKHGPVLMGSSPEFADAGDGLEADAEFGDVTDAYRQLSEMGHGSILGERAGDRGAARARAPGDVGQGPVSNVSRGIAVEPLPAIKADAAESERSAPVHATPERGGLSVGDPDPNARARERARLTNELAGILTTDAGDPRQTTQALLTLAALELVEPGILNSHYGDLSRSGAASLPPRDRQVVMAWRDFFRDAHVELGQTGDPAALAPLADALAIALDGARSLTIPEATLCTRVEGYGVYTPLPSDEGTYRLLAGRRHRVIVYAEVKHFVPSDARSGDGYEVSLIQDLALFHYADATDTLAWQRRGDEIRDESRNRRQDFFTAQIIELPETLSVGTYRLKVTIRDRTGGGMAERIVPIEVVADVSALGRRGS